MADSPKILKARLLIAAPELSDPNFARTVILMVDHSEDGAMGIVLNRPLDRTISDLWQEIYEGSTSCQAPVHWGGPVAGPLMVLHRVRALADVELMPGVYFSTHRDRIDAVMHADAPDLRFFIGCAGWSPGQLESEIEEGAWQVVSASTQHVFSDPKSLWDGFNARSLTDPIFDKLGLKHFPGDPEVN